MRNLKKIVSSGCFFLCLGGWVYSGQVIGAQEATGGNGASAAREAVLNAAAAQAATPGAVDAATPKSDSTIAQVTENPTVTPAGTAVTTSGAPVSGAPASGAAVQAKPTDLSTPTVNIEVDGRVKQINMQDMDINTALYFFSLQTKRNIIASKNVKGSVTVNLYNVTFQEALDAMLRPNGFDYIEKGNFIYVYTAEELADIRKRDRHTVSKIIHLKYTTALDASVLIKPMLSSTGQIAVTAPALSGLAEGNSDTGSMNYAAADTLVINDFPENVDEVITALKDIDVRPKQVLIESTVLNASLDDENALGIDLISISGADFSSLTSAALTTSAGSGGSGSTSGGSGSTGGVINGPSGLFNNFLGNKTQTNVGTDFASSVPSGGLSVGFLSNNIAMFMRALETVTDVTVVANPKILALNKQKGEVHIGQKLGYLTTSTTTTTTQQTVQFLDIGTKLIFRPYIGDDGYVRMEIHPEDSSGAIDSRGVPQTNTTEITSNVMIKDGRTIVIGGLFSESTTASKGQVPVIGNIPVLGVPFRKTDDLTHRQETIILVTPHVINDDTSLYEESLREQEDVQRMQLGNRSGLQPWGRDRIAHLWYAKAQDEVSKGDTEKALMYLDWCLNTNPRLLEAIKLREQLTDKKMDEKQGSSVVDLVKNSIKGDAATIPDKGGPAIYPPPAATAPATMPAENK